MRPRKALEERSVSHSISCTPLQWARMRELADRAGKRTSPYIVGRVLKREGFDAGETGHALVLDSAQQRTLCEAVASAEAALSQLCSLSGDAPAGLGETIALLFETHLDEMAQEGRGEEMEALLASVVGPARSAAIAERAIARSARGGAPGVR